MGGCPSSHRPIREETLEHGNLFSGSWISASELRTIHLSIVVWQKWKTRQVGIFLCCWKRNVYSVFILRFTFHFYCIIVAGHLRAISYRPRRTCRRMIPFLTWRNSSRTSRSTGSPTLQTSWVAHSSSRTRQATSARLTRTIRKYLPSFSAQKTSVFLRVSLHYPSSKYFFSWSIWSQMVNWFSKLLRYGGRNSTTAEEISRFQRLFPKGIPHPKHAPTFPGIDSYLMVTKWDFLEMEASLWRNERLLNVAEGWLST